MTDSVRNEALLTQAEKEFLLDLARQAVAAAVLGQNPPDPEPLAADAGVDLAPRLNEKRGVFVTLHLAGQLRGCIGYIAGIKPLVEAVLDNGASAAILDTRFSPVTGPELGHLVVEISALTPPRQVAQIEDIEIGRHGILLSKSGRQAVFLPQVAVEQGWDLYTTLGHLALKAGLAPNGWQDGAIFQVFEAEVF